MFHPTITEQHYELTLLRSSSLAQLTALETTISGENQKGGGLVTLHSIAGFKSGLRTKSKNHHQPHDEHIYRLATFFFISKG